MDNTERNISLIGKSGYEYYGKMYNDKNSSTSLSGRAVVCLSDTQWMDNHWQHTIRDIYNDDAFHALHHFKERDDITHMILIPQDASAYRGIDIIEDLRRQYIHK